MRYLAVALFLIPAVLHAVMLPAMAALGGGLRWQEWLTPHADGLYHAPASRGWGTLTAQGLAGHIVVNAIVGLLMVSFLAVFEEIGWRAWLLPRLADRLGFRLGTVFTSFIWAIWHVPFQLSGIQHIDGISPVNLALSIPFGIMATGLILGWLWCRTGSIWLVAIAHGSANNWGQYAFKYMQDAGAPDREMMAVNLGSLALFIVGAILLCCAGGTASGNRLPSVPAGVDRDSQLGYGSRGKIL
jgi:membrane protease YdiL (CAAX protease family)